ncbi:hypothetical protein SAMN02745129_2560 [Ferrimonas marina]|uniref:Uncharacterized protein n=1 Tax=Ferrimonas marina TaxID=299255 RepID=A0A1M5UG98_9GAMM|nr:hypothetical protein SAMN02745129_2560 [Ferrimonas marina]
MLWGMRCVDLIKLHIDRFGFFVIHTDDPRNPVCYTIGLTNQGLPEMVLSCAPADQQVDILSRIARNTLDQGLSHSLAGIDLPLHLHPLQDPEIDDTQVPFLTAYYQRNPTQHTPSLLELVMTH